MRSNNVEATASNQNENIKIRYANLFPDGHIRHDYKPELRRNRQGIPAEGLSSNKRITSTGPCFVIRITRASPVGNGD